MARATVAHHANQITFPSSFEMPKNHLLTPVDKRENGVRSFFKTKGTVTLKRRALFDMSNMAAS